jgi:hypothetical protein
VEGNGIDNNELVEHKLFPNSSTRSPAVEVVAKDCTNDMQSEKYNTQRDMCFIKECFMFINTSKQLHDL